MAQSDLHPGLEEAERQDALGKGKAASSACSRVCILPLSFSSSVTLGQVVHLLCPGLLFWTMTVLGKTYPKQLKKSDWRLREK